MRLIRALGVFSAFCLFANAALCVTDLNHPPGVRYVRLFALVIVSAMGLLEYKKPWYGFATAMFLWSLWFVLRDLLSRLSPLFHHLPWFHGGPLASCLCIAVWLRMETSIEANGLKKNFSQLSNWISYSLAALSISMLISTAYFYVRYLSGSNTQWVTTRPDFRHLLIAQPYSWAHPILGIIEALPPYALGLCIICAHRYGRLRIDWQLLAKSIVLSGVAIAALAVPQILFGEGYRWNFDVHPCSGPFPTRNVLAPILLIIATVCVSLGAEYSRVKKFALLFYVTAIVMTLTAIASGSRNGVFIFLVLGWAMLAFRPTKIRLACMVVFPVIVAMVIFLAPLQPLEAWRNTAARKAALTIKNIREGNFHDSLSFRPLIYQTACRVWWAYPVTGSGLNTYFMQVQTSGPFPESALQMGEPPVHAHNAILQNLAEGGPVAMTGWIVIFFVVPITSFVRNSRTHLFAMSVLSIGISNLVDYSWYTAGFPLLGMTILIVFIGRESERNELGNNDDNCGFSD